MGEDYLQFYTSYASIAVLYYDYCLTLPDEVKYIWGGRFRFSTVLYIFCRYALVANILYLLAIGGKLPGHCTTWYLGISALSVFGRLSIITTFTVRTYALYNRNLIVLGLLGSVGLATIILDTMHVQGVRCVGPSPTKPIISALVVILMLAFEVLSAILTFSRCFRTLGRLRGWEPLKKSFYYMVFEQGLVYYATTLALCTAKLLLNYIVTPDSYIRRVTNAFFLPILCTLTARFILHLRGWESKVASYGLHSTPPPLPTCTSRTERRSHYSGDSGMTVFGSSAITMDSDHE